MNKEINWYEVPVGTSFNCRIHDVAIEGKIQKGLDGEIFLCQNNENGNECDDKLGYRYSWSIGKGNDIGKLHNRVTYLRLGISTETISPSIQQTKNANKYLLIKQK